MSYDLFPLDCTHTHTHTHTHPALSPVPSESQCEEESSGPPHISPSSLPYQCESSSAHSILSSPASSLTSMRKRLKESCGGAVSPDGGSELPFGGKVMWALFPGCTLP